MWRSASFVNFWTASELPSDETSIVRVSSRDSEPQLTVHTHRIIHWVSQAQTWIWCKAFLANYARFSLDVSVHLVKDAATCQISVGTSHEEAWAAPDLEGHDSTAAGKPPDIKATQRC